MPTKTNKKPAAGLAGTPGYSVAQRLFDETPAEQKNSDILLTQVAEKYLNKAAARELA